MPIYPLTQSQLAAATTADALAFVKSPTVLARRLSEILNAQEFIGYSLLTGRYTVSGGAIAVPKNEVIRTERAAETVNPGAEYKLTPMSAEQYDIYQSQKRGLATEVADELLNRMQGQPIEDAIQLLKSELTFDANSLAVATIASKVTNTIAASGSWATVTADASAQGRQIIKDVLRARAQVSALRLGFNLDTVLLTDAQYTAVMPALMPLLPLGSPSLVNGTFPQVLGLNWISTSETVFTNPIVLDRSRLGGIARENILSPEYRAVGNTGVEIASIREPKADKTRIQARNPHVPVVTNAGAAVAITGTGL